MTRGRDYHDEMFRLSLDRNTTDRLLTGQITPDDAPPGLGSLAAVIQAASAPGAPSEVAREELVVPAAVAAVLSTTPPARPIARTKSMASKFRTAKVATFATIGVFGLGAAAAAAAGSLPAQTSHASSHAGAGLATAASHVSSRPGTTSGSAASARPTITGTSSTIPTTGPANTHAQFGLCTAFLATNGSSGGTQPPNDASTAFKALINQNGGVAATVAYCKTVAHPGSSTSNGKSAAPGKPASAGKPANAGRPANAGKPAGPGSSGSHAPVTTPQAGGTDTADTASGGSSAAG